jgi:hypothetical protein
MCTSSYDDLSGIDSNLADNLGRTIIYSLNVVTTFVTITYIGGWQFLVAAVVIGLMYFDSKPAFGLLWVSGLALTL